MISLMHEYSYGVNFEFITTHAKEISTVSTEWAFAKNECFKSICIAYQIIKKG